MNRWLLPDTILHPVYPICWIADFSGGTRVAGICRTRRDAVVILKAVCSKTPAVRCNIYDNYIPIALYKLITDREVEGEIYDSR